MPYLLCRMGASLCFSKFYQEFREHSNYVSIYILDILANLLAAVQLSHQDDTSLGSADMAKYVIAKYSRTVSDPAQGEVPMLRHSRMRICERPRICSC